MTCFKYRLKGQLEATAKCEGPIKTPKVADQQHRNYTDQQPITAGHFINLYICIWALVIGHVHKTVSRKKKLR